MELHIVGKNHLALTDAIKEYVNKKIASINDRFQHITTVNVVLHIDNLDHCAETHIHVNGHEISASAKGHDLYEAIDKLSDKIFAQLTKLKERNIDAHQ